MTHIFMHIENQLPKMDLSMVEVQRTEILDPISQTITLKEIDKRIFGLKKNIERQSDELDKMNTFLSELEADRILIEAEALKEPLVKTNE